MKNFGHDTLLTILEFPELKNIIEFVNILENYFYGS